MYKRLRKAKLKLKLIRNKLSSIKKCDKHIAIVSCFKYANKINEDIELQYYLYKNNISSDIVSWNSIDLNKYDALIIRSIWDFQENLDEFKKWLDKVNIPIFNDKDLIINNIDKESQYKLMDKYNIKHIETVFTDNKANIEKIWNDNFKDYDKLVVKPSISESGKNTYILNKDNINNIDLSNFKSKIMIEPFIPSIKDGEYSLIYFNHKLSHTVLRHPGILDSNTEVKEIEPIQELIDIGSKIESIDEYKNYLYLRLDFVKYNNEYLLLETELIDPMLFISKCENKKEIYMNFAKNIKSRLN